ncbi:MAG: flagellar hook-length control protein FliK [Armatimonadetes bacterium]|nr:flagellar hook-length control protein FliK [Armatimonadota bacterium]
MAAGPELSRDWNGDGNCAFPPDGSLVPELFPGLFLPPPDAGNLPEGLPGGGPEKNSVPEIFGGAVDGVWGAGGDPGRLAEVLQQAGYFPADLPPGAAVTPEAGDSRKVLQSLLALLWPAETASLPSGQAKTDSDWGVSFASAGVQARPAQGLNQFINLLKEILFFFRQQEATGLSNPEGNIETVNSLLAAGFEDVPAAAELEAGGAGIPDSAKALLRQVQAALLLLREQAGPENFRGSAVPKGSGEGSDATKLAPEQPAADQQVRLPVEIVRQESFSSAVRNSGGAKEQIASINQQDLPDGLFRNEKGLSAGAAGKNSVPLVLNYGNGAAGAVHLGGGQGNVAPSSIPALVMQVLHHAAGKSFAGETRLRLKLEPEHLGELVIRLVYRAGEVSAYFQASNTQAREAIENSLPQLREALAGQNLHLQNASVSVGQQESEFLTRENYGQAGYNYPRRSGGPGPEADLPGAGPETGPLPGYGSVNLFI